MKGVCEREKGGEGGKKGGGKEEEAGGRGLEIGFESSMA